MKQIIALVAVLAATLVVALPAGSTTAPGYNFTIKVTIAKGGRVTLSSTTAKRGWIGRFRITNKDSKPHRFDVGGLPVKKPIPPGGIAKLSSYLEDRGAFKIRVDGVFRGYFNVV